MNEKHPLEDHYFKPSQTPTPPPPLPPECGWIYTVKTGDFLSSIARQFGITTQAIIEVNPELGPPFVLQPGQNLLLPIQVHTVTPGQTLFSIGELYGFDWRDIARANQINPPYTIRPGQKLAIPGVTCTVLPPPTPPEPPPCPGFMYEIKAGDTLYNLAQQFGTTVDMILKYNPGIDPRRLQIGQKICIPVMAPSSEKRCIVLANTDTVPEALAVALLDYLENKIIVVLDQVPHPAQLGTGLNTYKAWLQSPQGYTVFTLFPTAQRIWAGRSNPAQSLQNYTRIRISAEKETNTAQPTGPVVATGMVSSPA